jgi:PAS domain S-box-containing protein
MNAASLARTNYAVRTAAFLYCQIVIGLHLWDRGASPLLWVFLVLQFAVYPHLLYLRAKYSDNPKRAELDNLFIDSALFGAWSALLGFPTWISFGLTGATVLNAAVNRGTRGAITALGCTGAGAALSLAIGGFVFAPETSTLVTALCFGGSLFYIAWVGIVVYLYNRRLTEARDALKEGEERYRFIAENAAELIALVDQGGRWLYVSPSYARIFDAADIELGVDAFRRVHPDDAENARLAVLRASATGKPRELALRLVDRDGRIRQFRTRVHSIGAGNAAEKKLMLVSQDVTDVRESEERLLLAAHALEGMTEAILIAAADGTVVTVNRAFCDITGYSREDVLGTSEQAIRNALQPPEFYDEVNAIVQREGYWSGTTWSRRKNGSVYREWRSVRAVRNAAGKVTHYVMVFYEVGASRAHEEGSVSA